MTPSLVSVMTLHVTVSAPLLIGDVGTGVRRVIPISGGTFAGPYARGEVVPGGADWNLRLPDGAAEVWARYTLRTHDGHHIGVVNAGRLHAEPDADGVLGHTIPAFEVDGAGPYRRFGTGTYVGTLRADPGGDGVQLEFFSVGRLADG